MDTFRVVLEGRCIDGFASEAVKASLTRLMRVTEAVAEQLLQGRETTVKQGVDQETGERYLTALKAAGMACRLEPENLAFEFAPDTSPPAQLTQPPVDEARESAMRAEYAEQPQKTESSRNQFVVGAMLIGLVAFGLVFGWRFLSRFNAQPSDQPKSSAQVSASTGTNDGELVAPKVDLRTGQPPTNSAPEQSVQQSFSEDQLRQVLATGKLQGVPIFNWNVQGYEFDNRTRIFVTVNNFNKPVSCQVDQLATVKSTGLLHPIPRFALTYTFFEKGDQLYFNSLMGGKSGMRFSFDEEQAFLELKPNLPDGELLVVMTGPLVRANEKQLTDRFLTASTLTVQHTVDIAYVYDLIKLRSANALARAVCK